MSKKWRLSEVVRDIKSAKEFIKVNKIKDYCLIVVWDEKIKPKGFIEQGRLSIKNEW